MTAIRSLTAASLALAAPLALAQSQAPGLWEQTMQMKSSDGAVERAQAQMQQQLAAMPAEQRRMVEQAMAQRNVQVGAAGTTVRFCLTKEQAARAPRPQITGTDCTHQASERSSATFKYSYACTQPQKVSGEGEMTFDGDKAYVGTTVVTTERAGAPYRMTMAMRGRWLGSDCGSVKPIGP